MAFRIYCGAILLLVFLMVFPLAVNALPEFSIDVVLEEDTFYTLPLLSESILKYDFTSSLDDEPYDTNVTADIITGDAGTYWEDTGLDEREVYLIQDMETEPKASFLVINTSEMISDGVMRTDCSDLALYDGYGKEYPYIIEDCDTHETKLKFSLDDTQQDQLNLYHSGHYSKEDTVDPYLFYEDFTNETDTENSWDISGNITFEEGYAYTDGSNGSSMNLTTTTIDSMSEVDYRFYATGNSIHNVTLAESGNISEKSFVVDFLADEGMIEACWTLHGNEDCSRYQEDFAEQWNDFRIDLDGDRLWLNLNGERLNRNSQYYDIDKADIGFEFEGMSFIEYFSVLEKSSTSFTDQVSEEHIDRREGVALQGDFGFEYDVSGFSSGNYTIATRATRPDLHPQFSFDPFSVKYEKLLFEATEEGYVNEMSGHYLIDTDGTLKITNPNDESLDIELDLGTNLMIEQKDGDLLKDGKLDVQIDAFSSVEIEYFTTGVANHPPVSNNEGVLITSLKSAIDDDVHEIGNSRFYKRTLEMEDAPDEPESPDDEQKKKELRFVVEDDAYYGVFTRLTLNKFFSEPTVTPGDVVEVMLRVTNHDPFSREVTLNDSLPQEFILLENPEERNKSWSFKMNKHTSRIFTYEVMYNGSSTGRVNVPVANLTSGDVLVESNEPVLLREDPSSKQLHVIKRYTHLNSTKYDIDNPVLVRLTVSNLGSESVKEIILEDSADTDMEFLAPSISTAYRGMWIIPELKPGETWAVEYLTNNGAHVKDAPELDSHVTKIDYSSHVSEKMRDEVMFDNLRRFSFSLSSLFGLLIIANILVILSYVYKNPFFELEEKTPKNFILGLYEQIPGNSRKFMDRCMSVVLLVSKRITKIAHEIGMKLFSWSKVLMKQTERYYEERNISLVQEKSMSAISEGISRINEELNQLRKMTLKDWLSLFSRYKKEFFRALRNRITYSMFSLSDKMLAKNKGSSVGQILNFSAKVLNPELDNYLAGLTDKRLKKKERSYSKEIQNIESLLEKNRKINQSSSGLYGRFRIFLRRIYNFFKK
ncbi:MAG: hypothetical protein ACLFTR_03650 [Candidatus Woesearchaeota archaeon]